MSKEISRRDFLKISGLGVSAAAVLTGCGPMSRHVTRQAYAEMPEYNQTGLSTYYATTCRECPAGCGMIVRTFEGRAIKAEGNPDHPVNKGKLCSRGLTSVQGLYNPDRIAGPQRRTRGSRSFEPLEWEDAVQVVQQGLSSPANMAFLMGLEPDHLYDLVVEITEAAGSDAPLRYSTLGTAEGRATLLQASQRMFGTDQLPYFDLSEADVVISFGASFFETWLSPVAYSRQYSQMRRQKYGKRGYLVSLEARQTLTGANADEWLPIVPGSEGLVALALGKLAAEMKNMPVPAMFENADIAQAAQTSGLSEANLRKLAKMFAEAEKPLVLPGGAALTTSSGLQAAEAILGLNVLAENLGQPGGVYLSSGQAAVSTLEDVKALIERMNAGEIEVLFIHGTNPVFELPPAFGFSEALQNVNTVVSFASFEDETAIESDYVFPDHTGLESFGYQRILPGSDRAALSSIQPVVQPIHNTKATADVLIAAAAASGGALADAIQYSDEVDFLQQKILPYLQAGGFYTAAELPTFWSKWLQYGGWWRSEAGLRAPSNATQLSEPVSMSTPEGVEEGSTFHLVTFFNQLGDGRGANRPWLQETPDPMTTVTWNSWIEINPHTAEELGIENDEIVEVKAVGSDHSIEAIVYKFPAIRPDTVAMPFGQGHTALGRYAEGRGANPAVVWTTATNQAGELAIGDTKVTITKTGKRRPLARQESKAGVYGDGEH